jgi:hypothetical protein
VSRRRRIVQAVKVWFDGAWIRNPAGESRLWGYGHRVVGAGLTHEGSHVNLTGHIVHGLSAFFSIQIDVTDFAAVPRVIRSIHVALRHINHYIEGQFPLFW